MQVIPSTIYERPALRVAPTISGALTDGNPAPNPNLSGSKAKLIEIDHLAAPVDNFGPSPVGANLIDFDQLRVRSETRPKLPVNPAALQPSSVNSG